MLGSADIGLFLEHVAQNEQVRQDAKACGLACRILCAATGPIVHGEEEVVAHKAFRFALFVVGDEPYTQTLREVGVELSAVDQDLLNRTRVAATQPEISGTGEKAVVSTALAMPAGGYAIFEWPIAPLVSDLQALTPPDIELKFSQQLGDGTPLEVLRIHASGNDGALRPVALTRKGWQLSMQSHQDTGTLPLWAALLTLLSGLIPLVIWGLRQSVGFTPSNIPTTTPLDNGLDSAFAHSNVPNASAASTLAKASLSKADTAGAAIADAGHDTNQTMDGLSAEQARATDGAIANKLADDQAVLNADADNAANATANAAFDELDLLEEQPEPVDPHGDALEFNLDETLLPDVEFNLGAGASKFPAHLFRAYDIRGAIDDLST
ncbi:MAG: hypothetical protein EOP50_15210, partial [Sphingobacteriales bacterium]